MKIIKYKKRDHHTYWKDEDGSIDEFVVDFDYHNGPECERCNYSFCACCEPDGYKDTNCKPSDEYRCERCNKYVSEHSNFCPNCGNDLKLEVIVEESDD